MEKTPALTTATAWRSADTGVGATIAAGSQKCTGITAALAMPKTNSASKRAKDEGRCRAGEDAALGEVQRAGEIEGDGDGRQQEADRGRHQREQIFAAARHCLGRRPVRHQRIGGERQRFVEQEQREEIAGEGDGHRGGDRDGEQHEELRVPRLAVRAHIADRIDRIGEPQHACNEREHGTKRLDGERDIEPRYDREHRHRGSRAIDDIER